MKYTCQRCGGFLTMGVIKRERDGKNYHVYCFWKLEEQEKENANQPRDQWGNPIIFPKE